MLPRSLPRSLAKRLMKETGFENTELDALWDQFRCLANYEWQEDPNKLYMAIDRKTFDRCFVPNTSVRPPPPSLIYDRMFAFYDTNDDGLIGFEEFLKGLASLNNKSNYERFRRVFRGYDMNGDGYVERKDFLRVFRAYYVLSRELTRDMVAGMEDDFLEGGARDVVLGSQPISSAFPGSIPSGEPSRIGEGKRVNREGDMEIVDNEGVLRQDGLDTGDRYSVVGDSAVREQFGRVRPMFPSTVRLSSAAETGHQSGINGGEDGEAEDEDDEDASDSDEDGSSSSVTSDHWPPAEHILEEDIIRALGAPVPIQEVTDPVDRARIGTAVYHRMRDDDQRRVDEARRYGIDERWRRRAFYTDEEDGATAPEGYRRDPDYDSLSDEDEDAIDEQQAASESHPPSPRSRSSSKVRFQDDFTDDYEVRSTTSFRSIPVGERWGGFEIPEVERDVGKEILYQVTQQGFNELLDILFKPKEDLLVEVYRTRTERKIWAREIEAFEKADPRKQKTEEDKLGETVQNRSLDDLLERAGYSVQSPSLGSAQAGGPVLSPSPRLRVPDDDVRPMHLADPEEDEEDEEVEEESDYEDLPELEQLSPVRPITPELQITHQNDSPPRTPEFDPTLPQHRPDDVTPRSIHPSFDDRAPRDILPPQFRLQPNGTTSFPAPPSLPSSSPEAEATAPKLPPSPIQSLPPPVPSSSSLPLHDETSQPPPRPSPRTLSRWALLNQVEREGKERGGTGAKLNFEEFSRRMAADRGRRLAFVASWIEMASF